MSSTCYPLFHASGSPRALGRAHGEQAADKIAAFLDNLRASLKLSTDEVRARAFRFRTLFEGQCPHLLEEVAGLAEGAKIDPADALAVQLRGELGQLKNEACTTFVIGPRGTADGKILIGQTSDTPPEFEEFAYILRLIPDDRPPLLMWTFGGMLGYHGLNAHGVAHFANSLGGGPGWKFALSHYPVKRMMLEQRSLADVVALLRRVPVCSNGNYVLCDGAGNILDVELTSDGPLLIDDAGAGFIVHSNHFLCAPHNCAANFAQGPADSFPRLDRMRSLIRENFGSITVADMKHFLSDHAGHPAGICRHPSHASHVESAVRTDREPGAMPASRSRAGMPSDQDGAHVRHALRKTSGTCRPTDAAPTNPMIPPEGKTVAALIAEPAKGVLHVAKGNPCEKEFVAHSVHE